MRSNTSLWGTNLLRVSWGQVNDIIPMRYSSYSITVLQF